MAIQQNITQVYGATPEQLVAAIFDQVKILIDDLKKEYQPKQPEDYLTRKQACDLLSVNASTLWSWCKAGKLEPVGIGGRKYFRRSSIDQAMISLKNNA